MATLTTSYELAKSIVAAKEQAENEAGKRLSIISGPERGLMGMTPEHIRVTPEWQAAHAAFWAARDELRKANLFMLRNFKREVAADRKARYEARRA